MLDPRAVTSGYAVSPQVAPEDIAEIARRGFTVVINNRPDGEAPGQPKSAAIAAAAAAAGLVYVENPVAGGFPPEAIATQAAALKQARGPALAFCATGTRSVVLWALATAAGGALSPADILAAADAAGYDLSGRRAALDAAFAAASG